MLMTLGFVAIAIWLFYGALKFYGRTDWTEAPENTPDFGQMRKKSAELQHIEEVLAQAQTEGKVSKGFMEELGRYVQSELDAMTRLEQEWKARKAAKKESSPGR